jgi:hypothetical protein
VQFEGAQQLNRPIYGWQEHHHTVYDTLGIDYDWHTMSTTRQHALAYIHTPCTWSI